MYKELLSEFIKLAETMDVAELESIAEDVMQGLDKMADAAADDLEKFANDYLEAMEKAASLSEEEAAALGLAGATAGAGTIAGGVVGVNKIKAMIPKWREDRAAVQFGKAEARRQVAEAKAQGLVDVAAVKSNQAKKSFEAAKKLNAGGPAAAVAPVSIAPAAPSITMKDSYKLDNRINAANPNSELVAKDLNRLRRADKAEHWLNGTRIDEKSGKIFKDNKRMPGKWKLLAGVGAGAYLLNQKSKNDKQKAMLDGAMGRR